MSKQFRFYMLPDEVESILQKLCLSASARVIEDTCPHPRLHDVKSITPPWERHGVRWNIIPAENARLEFRYIEERKTWIVHDEPSETIEFSGCGYSESSICEGRFYFRTDMLLGGEIWRKRPEVVTWADRVFRLAKRELQYLPDRQVYVSPAAARWQRDGGRLEQFLREIP